MANGAYLMVRMLIVFTEWTVYSVNKYVSVCDRIVDVYRKLVATLAVFEFLNNVH